MRAIDIMQRKIGVNYTNGTASVSLWAPNATKASICLYIDGTKSVEEVLQKQEKGYWSGVINVTADMQYLFKIDDGEELPDPASLFQPNGVHGPSQVFNAGDFSWSDNRWKNPSLEQYIFYELHAGTFTQNGTFDSIGEKLDYLLDLGITAIEIMPVAQFPGKRNWGYDGVFPYAVQNSYGGPQKLQNLVNKCHEKGLAVVLDVVYNHLGPEGNYLPHYGPYFTDKYKTPWGNAINYDDAHCDEVRRYFIENALMWFRDFHIDALRLDAVHAIKDMGAIHILKEIRQYTDQLMQATGHTHYLIVECDLNDTKYIDDIEHKGYGMHSQWTDEFHHALRVAAGNERTGYYADFNGLEDLAKAYKDAYVYTGQYSNERLRSFGVPTADKKASNFIAFSQNHDQVGNRMLGERTAHLVSYEMLKLMAGAVMVSPFLPLVFMGEEWASPNPFQYFISHSDSDLVSAVCEGRKKEFAAFHSTEDVPVPQDEQTFDGSKLNWDIIDQEEHSIMLSYYKALIALRKSQHAFKSNYRNNIEVTTSMPQKLLILHRWHEKSHIICIMNFSDKLQRITSALYKGTLQKILSSADEKWGGPGHDDSHSTVGITALPESIIIYTATDV